MLVVWRVLLIAYQNKCVTGKQFLCKLFEMGSFGRIGEMGWQADLIKQRRANTVWGGIVGKLQA